MVKVHRWREQNGQSHKLTLKEEGEGQLTAA
jgi:hypothetical protein